MKKAVIFICLFFVSFSACAPSNKIAKPQENKISSQTKSNSNVHFYTGGTLTEVIERAKNENKLVFIDFTADWCAPCKLMEDEVYTYKELYNKINNNFISYQIDIEKDNGPNLAFLYGVKTLPTLLYLDTRGRVLIKKEGSADIQTMLNLSQEAIDKSR